MKIHFAYRTVYEPNGRYLKTFEADSILDFFLKNWKQLTKDPDEILGTYVYGFPISSDEIGVKVHPPIDFNDLIAKLGKHVYCNEIVGDEECLEIYTDDDEVELAWYIFTEDFKEKNWRQLAIWFQNPIPTDYGSIGKNLLFDFNESFDADYGTGCLYHISCCIYDSGNFDDLYVYEIDGLRMPQLLDYLRNNEIDPKDELVGLENLKFLKHLTEENNKASLNELLNLIGQICITDMEDEDFRDFSIPALLKKELGNNPEKSTYLLSEHFCEIGINSLENQFNYFVLFDDLWVEKNEVIAQSLLQFGSNWRIRVE